MSNRDDGSSAITIRGMDADRGDLESWTAIHNQRSVALGTLRLPFTPLEFWRARFEGDAQGRVLLAEIDGQIVGGAGFHIDQLRRHHVGSFGMGVDVTYQGRGVGSALMAAIIDLADNWYNLRRLELEVYADNVAGITLYRKFGFEEEGMYRKYAFRDGSYVDALAMARICENSW